MPDQPAPLLLHVFPTFAVGGAQARFAAIANRFGPLWRHAIVAMDGNTACRERLEPGLAVSFPVPGIHKGDTLGNVRRFRAVLRALAPHTLVTSNWGSIEWALANAPWPWLPPLVRQVHVEDGFGPEERVGQLRRRVLARRWALRHATVALPSRTLGRIATEIWRLDQRRLHYVPNGIDLARPPGDGAACPWSGKGPVVGTVAALRVEKNLGRLLRAFLRARAATPDARLVIVGDGPERAGLEALAHALGLEGAVHFTGHVARPRALYDSFDLFALSSDTEQMPLSVLEAMAAGLPVAATDVGDVRAMLGAEGAAFVTALDDEALARALAALLAQPDLRRELGAANRARAVREYGQEAMFQSYRALFMGEAREDGGSAG